MYRATPLIDRVLDGWSAIELDAWIGTLPQPRTMAMEATIFTGWIYDHPLPHAEAVEVAHPLMLRAIALAKKKNDKIDASKLADCLRCDCLPKCHMASTEIRDRRRVLRYRHLLVRHWSARTLAACADCTALIINPIVYPEVSIGFSTIEALDAALPLASYERESSAVGSRFPRRQMMPNGPARAAPAEFQITERATR
ncbi:MAG: hypothetical protein WBW84_02280 [Acidobacteriaceae bacterium]